MDSVSVHSIIFITLKIRMNWVHRFSSRSPIRSSKALCVCVFLFEASHITPDMTHLSFEERDQLIKQVESTWVFFARQ